MISRVTIHYRPNDDAAATRYARNLAYKNLNFMKKMEEEHLKKELTSKYIIYILCVKKTDQYILLPKEIWYMIWQKLFDDEKPCINKSSLEEEWQNRLKLLE